MTTTEHQTAECSVSDCPCHGWSRQDPPLVQLPLEHARLRSLRQAHNEDYQRGYQDGWDGANLMRLRAENDYLRTMRGMIEGRMER